MRRTLFLLAALVLMVTGPAVSRTWYIMPDGSGDAPTIQAGIDSAVVGDTVLVAPGTYYEHLTMAGGVSLISQLGRGATKIEPVFVSGSLITCQDLSEPVTIAGFAMEYARDSIGGAIHCVSSDVTIKDNRFANNAAYRHGGAIACVGGSDVAIWNNLFFQNLAVDGPSPHYGGAIFCSACSPLIQGNTFSGDRAGDGGAIGCVNLASPEIRENVFDNIGNSIFCAGGAPVIQQNTFQNFHGTVIICEDTCSAQILENEIVNGDGSGIACRYYGTPVVEGNTISGCRIGIDGAGMSFIDHCNPIVRYNLFSDNGQPGSSGGAIYCSGYCTPQISYNVFYNNIASFGGAIFFGQGEGAVCEWNTFIGNVATEWDGGGSIHCHYSSTGAQITNCIIGWSVGYAAVVCLSGATAALDCNDYWQNETNFYGCSAGPNDFFEDPRFCDLLGADFTLDESSPCAPGNSPSGCDLVGAEPTGCAYAGVEPGVAASSTWGAIKSMYR